MGLFDINGNIIASNDGVLYGKKWAVCGDSVSSGDLVEKDENGESKAYYYYIAKRNNMTLYHDGISGTTMTNASSNSFSNTRYKNVPLDCDYITLWFGINDSQDTLGTIDDTDTSTMYGAYNTVLTYFIENMPNAKIGLVVSHATSSAKQEVVKKIAEKFGLKTFDIYSDETIPYWHGWDANKVYPSQEVYNTRKAQWWRDGSHPVAAGHEYISTAFEAWMRTL